MISIRTNIHVDDDDYILADLEDSYQSLDLGSSTDAATRVCVFIEGLEAARRFRDQAQRILDHLEARKAEDGE